MSAFIVIVDERNGKVREDGSNLSVPEDGVVGYLTMLKSAEVVVSISNDGMFVKKGIGKVSLMQTRSEPQLSGEQAARQATYLDERRAASDSKASEDALTKGARVWDDVVE